MAGWKRRPVCLFIFILLLLPSNGSLYILRLLSKFTLVPNSSPQPHPTTMNEDVPPQLPCIRQSPHLAECPDFSDVTFEDLVQSLVGPDRTREQAIGSLRSAWCTQNNRRRALWSPVITSIPYHPAADLCTYSDFSLNLHPPTIPFIQSTVVDSLKTD